jgi:hypothetical protein
MPKGERPHGDDFGDLGVPLFGLFGFLNKYDSCFGGLFAAAAQLHQQSPT